MEKWILKNSKGYALVIGLIMLLILTLLGISAITTTTYETSISGNERIGTEAFYASEAGIQVALHKLPDTTPISLTKLGEYSYYWSGSPEDKSSPRNIKTFGTYPIPGYDVTWTFNRFQVNVTGESFGAYKEIEVQVAYGPIPSGTLYNP
jgi:hypothetical protein